MLFRSEVIDFLKKRSIPTAIHYPKLLPDQEALCMKNKGFIKNLFRQRTFKSYSIPNARNLVSKVLSLPMHPLLNEKDQDLIVETFIEANNLII